MQIFRQRLVHNVFALLISSGGSTLLSLLLFALIGRTTGEDGLGVYATVLAWIFPLSIMAEFGLGTLITRNVAQAPHATHDYLVASVRMRLVVGGGVCLGLLMGAPVLSDDPLIVTGLRIAAPLVVALPLYGSLTAIFRAHQRMRPIAWLNIGMLLVQLVLTASALAAGGDVLVALGINTLTSLGQVACAGLIYGRGFRTPPTQPIRLGALMREAWPFAIAAVLGALQLRLDVILLAHYTSAEAVGYYAAALRFLDAGRLASRALFDALYPAFAEGIAHATGGSLLRRSAVGLLLVGLVVALVGIWLSEWALWVIFGVAFVPAAPILQLLALSFLPMTLRQLRTVYGFAQGDTAYINIVNLILLAMQVGLSIWLVPQYGAFGAAGIVLAIEVIGAILLWARAI